LVLTAPLALMTSDAAATDTLSGASISTYASFSPNAK
jgi:hypothetical protein